MALLHHSTLTPTKIELVEGWAPSQPWFRGEAGAGLANVAAYRFDDPEGSVGVETILVRAGDGPVMQVPLTYRDAPLAGADASLIGTLEHSVLGTRWVYDAVGDPVYLTTVATAIATGGTEAEMYFEVDGKKELREPTARVAGSGISDSPAPTMPSAGDIIVRFEDGVTVAETASLTVAVARIPGVQAQRPDAVAGAGGVLTGTWAGQPERQSLVSAFVR